MKVKISSEEEVLMEVKMVPERFKELLEELDGNSVKTLAEKNARYATNGDCLHNFRSGADIAGGTPAQACWGYLTKHLVALRDMVEKDDFSNREDFLEKCQDTINYIRFLWCIGNDRVICEEDPNAILIELYNRKSNKRCGVFTPAYEPTISTEDGNFTIKYTENQEEKSVSYSTEDNYAVVYYVDSEGRVFANSIGNSSKEE